MSDSLFEASVNEQADKFRHLEGYDDLTEKELRGQMEWMLRNNPELIPGLEGEDMPTIRNTERIEQAKFTNRIKADKDWLSTIQMYATKQAISFDEALHEEANRLLKNESLIRDEYVFDTAVFIQMKKQEIIKSWRPNPKIMQMIQQKAKERDLPIDVVLEQDAQWVINKQIEEGSLFQ